MTLSDLTKGNVWTLNESEVSQMLIEGKKHDDYAENEAHYMNILRPVFDVQLLNREDSRKVDLLESQHYEIFSFPDEGVNNAIAIRKRPIKKVTDLTLENIRHIEASEVLALIEGNMGTGWKGLPLAIQDVIEAAFFVDCCVLPAYAMHRPGGIIERRKADGYEVLELDKGGWIEAIFIKVKPAQEKMKFETTEYSQTGKDDDKEEELEEEEDSEDADEDDENDEDIAADEDDEELDEPMSDEPSFEELDNLDMDVEDVGEEEEEE